MLLVALGSFTRLSLPFFPLYPPPYASVCFSLDPRASTRATFPLLFAFFPCLAVVSAVPTALHVRLFYLLALSFVPLCPSLFLSFCLSLSLTVRIYLLLHSFLASFLSVSPEVAPEVLIAPRECSKISPSTAASHERDLFLSRFFRPFFLSLMCRSSFGVVITFCQRLPALAATITVHHGCLNHGTYHSLFLRNAINRNIVK